MMRISEHGHVIITFAASVVLLAQGDTFPTKAQNRSNVPDARQIMESSIAAAGLTDAAQLHLSGV